MTKLKYLIQHSLYILIRVEFDQNSGFKNAVIKTEVVKYKKIKKSTKTSVPTGHLGATSLTHIGKSFLYYETSSASSGSGNFF